MLDAPQALKIAVVGAGPVGLALALLGARSLPHCALTIFDARDLHAPIPGDARTLALALGSVQLLQRLGAWPAAAAEAITAVHVSQAPPSWGQRAELLLSAADQGVESFGAVLAYGPLVAALQSAWERAAQAEPARLHSRFGTPVVALKNVGGGVEVDAGVAEQFDIVVVAEGGVFADQARKALTHDYQQTAWVGTVTLDGATTGLAVERFTRHGPVALLPLPARNAWPNDTTAPTAATALTTRTTPAAANDGGARAALVWCADSGDDPVNELDDRQRIVVLNSILPAAAGRITGISPLKKFPLGLNAERSLVDGRQVRIGNAAQTLHPVAGQGLNLGLRDAYALVQALRFSGDVDGALRQVEWQRAPDRWSMIAGTDFLARSFTWQLPGLAAARGLALAALNAVPPLQRALARQMMFGWR
jgi:2-octaprenyl-6-methoxyphenol hydroxylase